MTPYIVYILSFLGVMAIYLLNWSDIYPKLSLELVTFLVITFICAYIFHKKDLNKKPKYKKSYFNRNIEKILLIIFGGFAIDFIYAGIIPVFGSASDYLAFEGIPFVHVLLYTFTIFSSIYIFKVFIDNKNKKVLLLYWILTFIPGICLVSRGMIMNILIGCFFVVLIKVGVNIKNIKRYFISMTTLILIGLYLFGVFGNIRNNNINKYSDKYSSLYIMEVGGASEEFRQSIIPKPFFWAYTYIASPLANLQLNINEYEVDYSFSNFNKFIVKEILPDFISKRLDNGENLSFEGERLLVAPTLTVATYYIGAFNYIGWIGMISIFLFLMLVIYIYDKLISNENPFKVISVAMLCNITVLCTFDNMISYSGMSFQLIYPLIWEVLNYFRKRKNYDKEKGFNMNIKEMKVLLVNRKDAYDKFGGDTVQMCNTQKELKKIGIECDIALGEQEESFYSKYDIIHIFNIQTEKFTLKEAKKVKKLSKLLVVSPIWWSYQKLMNDIDNHHCSKKVKFASKVLGKKNVMLLKEFNEKRRNLKRKKILDMSNLILPNSIMEVEDLKNTFKEDYSDKCKVIYNGVEDKFINANNIKFNDELCDLGLREFSYVTQVGRGEVEKNTLLTIRACNSLKIPLVIVGQFTDVIYEELCKKEAINGQVYFLGRKNADEIIEINKYSKAHILPSYRETPGLSSLEAAVLGCNIVTTIVGSTKEYFEDYVFYCDPNDYNSIKTSIELAWGKEKNKELSNFVSNKYTWKNAAEQTKNAYEFILNRGRVE